ncbi:DUF4363 family protein [Priestia koreensis]|uniref:DUF4363 family protein n=1 Tax=Priestia koreensis TaxID=284581 RepID=UPI001F55E82E|nr:DUF4363 family protein [Priestia koreensis]UNL84081.1 DUF4363 family protein [Priestia koreensis]
MSQKQINLSLLGLLLLIYIGIWAWQYVVFFKETPSFEDNVQQVMKQAERHEWQKAGEQMEKVEKQWDRGKIAVSIKTASMNHSLLTISLRKLKSSVSKHDEVGVKREGEESLLLFRNTLSLIPRF